jgi:predicted Zn-dependent peptidase
VLPNGMRYVVMKNATPPGEASLRLHIAAGSLMEEENQLGLAHFMEHMVFNGTRNVPEGEFVRRLERHGLAFGPDTNAYTSFDETVYMLELPETDTAVVDTALLLMREAGGEALMAAEAIDRERGVVLSEERTRDTPQYRMIRTHFDFLLKGQRLPSRFPIGTAEVIRSASRERFVSFYEGYYRPENATFVAVGDFDPAEMERKIRERFSDWRGQGPAGREPDLGRVAPRRSETKVFHEPGAPASVRISFLNPPDLTPDTRAKQRREWVEQLGLAVLNRRFERLARQDRAPFLGASARHDTEYRSADITQVTATYRPRALAAGARGHRPGAAADRRARGAAGGARPRDHRDAGAPAGGGRRPEHPSLRRAGQRHRLLGQQPGGVHLAPGRPGDLRGSGAGAHRGAGERRRARGDDGRRTAGVPVDADGDQRSRPHPGGGVRPLAGRGRPPDLRGCGQGVGVHRLRQARPGGGAP